MSLVDVRSVGDWSDAAKNRSEMVSSGGVRASFLTQSTRLSNFEADTTSMILRPFWLQSFVRFGLDFLHCILVLSSCRLERDIG